MILDKKTSERIQKDGATARAMGIRSRFDNPYYKTENLPAKTGEDPKIWQAKAEAWDFGYQMENMLRT